VEIKTTDIFNKSLVKLYKKDIHILDTLESLIEKLKIDSSLGINLGNNRYKIRVKNRSNNKGKSAGYRVITYTKIRNIVLLVYIYSKSDIDNILDKKIDDIISTYKIKE